MDEIIPNSLSCYQVSISIILTSGPMVEHHSTSKLSLHMPETQECPYRHRNYYCYHASCNVHELRYIYRDVHKTTSETGSVAMNSD